MRGAPDPRDHAAVVSGAIRGGGGLYTLDELPVELRLWRAAVRAAAKRQGTRISVTSAAGLVSVTDPDRVVTDIELRAAVEAGSAGGKTYAQCLDEARRRTIRAVE